jgi:phosphoribosylamine--glycine ligase
MAKAPEKLNILVVGGGAREHALVWRLHRSASRGALFTTHPSNPGIAGLARPMGFDFRLSELYRVEQFCRHEKIDLVVVGPEDALAAGIADTLTSDRTAVFGPSKEAAQLESDKAFSKKLMRAASVPTAEAKIALTYEEAARFIESREDPLVVKAAGLAAGKGVVVTKDKVEAFEAARKFMTERTLGDAGATVVLEERLTGPEASVFALVDGRNIVILDSCQDHKRLLDGDEGPNTGGMGAVCPTGRVDQRTLEITQRQVIVPIVDALRREGIEFRGVLYVGLILTHAGPKVLEFNVRFGDPECQCLVRRMKGDFARLLHATATGRLHDLDESHFDTTDDHVCCVVAAAAGYPDAPRAGDAITGIEDAEAMPGVTVFLAGVKREKGGGLVTAGGRVVSVVGVGDTPAGARDTAYAGMAKIRFAGMQVRTDIGSSVAAARV